MSENYELPLLKVNGIHVYYGAIHAIKGMSLEVYEGEMAHARFYPEEIRRQMPKCSYRKYTVSEIINAMIRNGFSLKKFDEHPAWEDDKLPGEFTAVAIRT